MTWAKQSPWLLASPLVNFDAGLEPEASWRFRAPGVDGSTDSAVTEGARLTIRTMATRGENIDAFIKVHLIGFEFQMLFDEAKFLLLFTLLCYAHL